MKERDKDREEGKERGGWKEMERRKGRGREEMCTCNKVSNKLITDLKAMSHTG